MNTNGSTANNNYGSYLGSDLFDELGIKYLTPEERVAFLEAIGEVVHKKVMLRVMKTLTDQQKEKLVEIHEKNPDNPNASADFILSALPNFEDIVKEEAGGYKKELIERFKK
jgi:hypothetical protein